MTKKGDDFKEIATYSPLIPAILPPATSFSRPPHATCSPSRLYPELFANTISRVQSVAVGL